MWFICSSIIFFILLLIAETTKNDTVEALAGFASLVWIVIVIISIGKYAI